jgi:hypothetical protein
MVQCATVAGPASNSHDPLAKLAAAEPEYGAKPHDGHVSLVSPNLAAPPAASG